MELSPDNQISPDDVRAILARLVESSVFSSSPQLIKFIQYVVQASLSGTADKIKAYSIGVDVLGRSEDFDPQIDPIVRVEARRLRQAIESFYAGPGADEPIRIEIPRGSYAPIFHRRLLNQNKAHEGSGAKPPKKRLSFSTKSIRIYFELLATICATLMASYFLLDQYDAAKIASNLNKAHANKTSGLRNNGMPMLYVDPDPLSITDNKNARINIDLRRDLLDVFSRFDAINISSIPDENITSAITTASRNHNLQTRFILKTNITDAAGGIVDISFRLVDTDESELIWSKDFNADRTALERDNAAMKIAATVGAKLLEPYGVIRAYERRRALDGATLDPRYSCIIDTFGAFLSFEQSELGKIRGCLENLTRSGDTFAVGLPYLAAVYNRLYLFGDDAAAARQAIIDLALETARRGVEFSPASARAYQALFVALFNHKDIDEAFKAGKRALELNPYDSSLFYEFGGRLILNGDIDRGLSIMQKCYTQGSLRPALYHYFMFLGYYFKGNLVEARHHTDQLPKTYAFRYLARTLMAIADRNYIVARENYDHLSKIQPRFAKDPRAWLTMFFTEQSLVDRIVSEFKNAKLMTAASKEHI